MIYNNLIINEKNFNALKKFKDNNKLPNAFIFHGNEGAGKEAHAIEFFALLNCKKNNKFCCGHCSSCIKTKKLQHEDLVIIFPLPKNKTINKYDSPLKTLNNENIEKMNKMIESKGLHPYSKINFKNANTILINSVREIKKNINLSIDEGKYKTYLIFNAEKLCYPKNESANSLLKVLEEPPENVLFILITSDISLLIDTLISRCVPIYFPKLSNPIIKSYLDIHFSKNKFNSEISAICNGNITNALSLTNNFQTKINILKNIINMITYNKYQNIHEILPYFKNKEDSLEILNLLCLYFRDILLKKNNFHSINSLTIVIVAKYKNTNWEKCIFLINKTHDFLLKNGQNELVITALFIEINKILENKYHDVNVTEDYLNYNT